MKCPDGGDRACTGAWGEESVAAALGFAYVGMDGEQIGDGDEITDEYAKDRLQVIEQRLAQGGVRLAAILDQIGAQH